LFYYSRTGNAKFVAETAAKELGADVEEIVDKKSRAGPLGWVSAGKAGSRGEETENRTHNKEPRRLRLDCGLGHLFRHGRPLPPSTHG
jgi:flavodoxin